MKRYIASRTAKVHHTTPAVNQELTFCGRSTTFLNRVSAGKKGYETPECIDCVKYRKRFYHPKEKKVSTSKRFFADFISSEGGASKFRIDCDNSRYQDVDIVVKGPHNLAGRVSRRITRILNQANSKRKKS